MKLNGQSILALGLVLAGTAAQATTINVTATAVRSGGVWGAVAVDATSGKVYQKNGYDGAAGVTVYANAAAFEANSGGSAITLGAGTYGPYFAAMNGALYGRTGNAGNAQLSRFNANTGAVLSTVTETGMGGTNGSDTFDWGGFSGVNAMTDGQHLFVLGNSASSNAWMVRSLNPAMATQTEWGFNAGSVGFAFAINNYVFLGDTFSSGHISRRLDMATGTMATVDYTLSGFSNYTYLSDMSYDAVHDALYAYNAADQRFYKMASISTTFDVARQSVPEPGSLAVIGLGLAAAGLARRQRKA